MFFCIRYSYKDTRTFITKESLRRANTQFILYGNVRKKIKDNEKKHRDSKGAGRIELRKQSI